MEFVNFMREEVFRQKVDRLFEEQKNRIQSLLPEADIQHIGSTAIPNSLTKGDLDIQVRIPAELFTVAVNALSKIYDTNDGSHRSTTLAAFKDDALDPPLGVQLTVIGGEEDFFWKLRDFLKVHDNYRLEYDNLKKQFEAKVWMNIERRKVNLLKTSWKRMNSKPSRLEIVVTREGLSPTSRGRGVMHEYVDVASQPLLNIRAGLR